MNHQKFEALKKLKLPLDQYAITGSGPLGIRNLRKISDIDIVVSSELKNAITKKYGVTDDGKVQKVVFPGGSITAFWKGSFYTQPQDPQAPTTEEIILRAEIIEGLPFASLEDILYFKRKMKRDKDLNDIALVEKWQKA